MKILILICKSRIDFDLINEYKNERNPKQLSLFETSVDVNSKIIEKEFTNLLKKVSNY